TPLLSAPFLYKPISNPLTYSLSLHDALPICVTLGLTDLNGEVCAHREFPTQQHLHSNLFKEIERCVDSMRSQLQLEDADILGLGDRKSTRLNSSHVSISYAVFCLKKKKIQHK